MGNSSGTPRFPDDSDVLVTFDPRARILDVPDDGRVMDILSGAVRGAPPRQAPFGRPVRGAAPSASTWRGIRSTSV